MSDSTARLWSRAQRHLAENRTVAARISLESLLQRDPRHAHALLILGQIARTQGRVRDAISLVLKFVHNSPGDAALSCEAAETLLGLGETLASRSCLDAIVLDQASDGALLARVAALRKKLGEHTVALELLDRAALAGEASPDFRFQHALELIFNDRMREATMELDTALLQRPTFGRAALALTRLHKQSVESNHLVDLRERLAHVEHGSEDHVALEFAFYKELEDTGNFPDAWTALQRGNRLMFAKQSHNPAFAWQLFELLIHRCTPALLDAGEVARCGPQPIFIIGMPRSGTTLLDRVLGNHSKVTSAGELDEFGLQLRWAANHGITLDEQVLDRLGDLDYAEMGRRYLSQTQWRANGAAFYVDKLPRNWMVAGLIHRALPQARILNLVRDPMDVCFSNYRALLGELFPWSYDQNALAQHYLQYRRVLDHWHSAMPGVILDVDYGELTRDPEAMARKVLSFCGLDWEPGCVDLTRNKGVVATLSMSQVREPIHTRFFNEWRRYEPHLLALQRAIGA
ncbi:MAG: sulfotransferase [Rhodanobacter sp.]